ncbi:hypothetical protein HYPSUDRAFT_42237 [Hypholoma sublateritium FD-334 SS-4]|uniref:Uncharacterized protein n=1 Tax=Hypholoma sublateritium (strain FD-334 SS-4) TaxID=945553 RepID=A0A0D2PN97_HYPSF|nr:hypothetical protein HYPSUDRAFT_42237 [Hypholoma sublateritium FD-334 SS-4]
MEAGAPAVWENSPSCPHRSLRQPNAPRHYHCRSPADACSVYVDVRTLRSAKALSTPVYPAIKVVVGDQDTRPWGKQCSAPRGWEGLGGAGAGWGRMYGNNLELSVRSSVHQCTSPTMRPLVPLYRICSTRNGDRMIWNTALGSGPPSERLRNPFSTRFNNCHCR